MSTTTVSQPVTKQAHPVSDSVHFTLQGKGGVGKSFVASILAQYFVKKQYDVSCYDTDPVNQTFHGYKQLDVNHLVLLKDSKIDERQFDSLMDDVYHHQRVYIIDNGSTSFIPLSNYFGENDTFSIIGETGKQIYIHCVVTGGQAMQETLTGLLALLQQTHSAKIVVWLNEYFGPIEHAGKGFTEMALYTNNRAKIHGLVTISKRNPETFGQDLRTVLERKQTFDEAIAEADASVWVKARLASVQRDLFKQLDLVLNG
jgi:transcription termination factor NusB